MFKQVIVIILLSLGVILSMPYAQHGLQFIVTAEGWVSEALKQIFSGGEAGNLIRELLALLVIPVTVGLVPVVIFWIGRRRWFTYFMELVWVVWLLQTAALIILFKTISGGAA